MLLGKMNARLLFPGGHTWLISYNNELPAPMEVLLMTASRRQAQRDLEAVIDEPLKRGERANHGDSHW